MQKNMYQIEQLEQWCFNLNLVRKKFRNGAKGIRTRSNFMKPGAEATLRDNPRFRLSGNDWYLFSICRHIRVSSWKKTLFFPYCRFFNTCRRTVHDHTVCTHGPARERERKKARPCGDLTATNSFAPGFEVTHDRVYPSIEGSQNYYHCVCYF